MPIKQIKMKMKSKISIDCKNEDENLNDTDTTTTTIKCNSGKIEKKRSFDSKSKSTIGGKSSKSGNTSTDEKILEIDGSIQIRYTVKARLGKGAYGIVWEAEEISTGNDVALKKIFDAFRNDTDAQRTYREIIFLREFGRHPNIIKLMNAHRASNNLDIYLVFPLMDSDLHKVIKNSPDMLKDNIIRSILYQILKAVKYLHSADVIHRDLKPANILLDQLFNVKVGDFGLARSIQPNLNDDDNDDDDNEMYDKQYINPPMTDYVATRWYRPPEILLSCNRYSKAVDMWSLGCILAEMIRKKPIFPGNTTIEQIEIVMGIIEEPTIEEIDDICTSTTKPMIDATLNYPKESSLGNIFDKCEYDTIDLIEKLLIFHPNQRLTVEQTLSHSFLAKYRNYSEEIIFDHPICPPLNDNTQLSLKEYRNTIYELIKIKRHQQRHLYPSVTARQQQTLIPISKSTIGMVSTTTHNNSNSNHTTIKGKNISVHTLPKKQNMGIIGGELLPALTSGIRGITLKKNNGISKENGNIKLKNTRSSITFSNNNIYNNNNNNNKEREKNTSSIQQFKTRSQSQFNKTLEGENLEIINPGLQVESKLITKPKRKIFSYDDHEGCGEYSKDMIIEPPPPPEEHLKKNWTTPVVPVPETSSYEHNIIKNKSPIIENYIPRSLLPVHTTISACKREKLIIPSLSSSQILSYDSADDLNITHRPETVKETTTTTSTTNGFKKYGTGTTTTKIIDTHKLFTHSIEEIPNRNKDKNQIHESVNVNRASTSIPWLSDLIKAKDQQTTPKLQKSNKIKYSTGGGTTTSTTGITTTGTTTGTGTSGNIILSNIGSSSSCNLLGGSRSREKVLAFGSVVSRWDENRSSDDKKQDMIDREQQQQRYSSSSSTQLLGKGNGHHSHSHSHSHHSRSKMSLVNNNNNNNKGKEKDKKHQTGEHELNISTILQSWSNDTKTNTTTATNPTTTKVQGQISSNQTTYEISSRSRRQQQRFSIPSSSYFPEIKMVNKIQAQDQDTTTKKHVTQPPQQPPLSFYRNNPRKSSYDYSQSHGIISASDLSELKNYGR